jgi:transposase
MRRPLKVTKMSSSEIELLLKKQSDYQVGLRLAVIYLVSKGATSRDVAIDLPMVKHVAVCEWVKRFNKDGVDGLYPIIQPGKPSKATSEQLSKLKQVILEESPENHGYNTGTWTGPLLIDWLDKNMNIQIKKASIYVWLKDRLGLRHKKGKGFYPEADEQLRSQRIGEIKKTLRN